MGEFGDAIAALLQTYSKCLSLLKRLQSYATESKVQLPWGASRLRKQLQSDRRDVRTEYSSGISHRGSAFETGDGK